MTNLFKIAAISGIVIASLSSASALVNGEHSASRFKAVDLDVLIKDALNLDVLIEDPAFGIFDANDNHEFKLSCYGCLSTETYRPRTEYVRPHVRSNGTYVDGYWRS